MRDIQKHTDACDTMNMHMQRQTTGMPYLLKDKQCIQQESILVTYLNVAMSSVNISRIPITKNAVCTIGTSHLPGTHLNSFVESHMAVEK